MYNEGAKHRPMTFWDHLAIIIKWRKLFIIVMLIMAISSVTYALIAKKWWVSEAKVLPPTSNLLAVSSFLPNLNLGMIGQSGIMSNETNLVLTILGSRKMKDLVINRFGWTERFKFTSRKEAYKHYFKKVKWEVTEDGAISVSVEERSPENAAETVNFMIDEIAKEYNNITVEQARSQRHFIEKRLDEKMAEIDSLEHVFKEFQRETGVVSFEDQIKVTVQALAAIQTQLIIAEVELEVFEKILPQTSTEVVSARQTVLSLTNKLNKLKRESNREDYSLLIGLDVAPDIAIPFLRMERQLELEARVLEFLMPQYEQTRIMELQEVGTLYILDYGNIPDKRHKPRRAFLVIGWMFISFVILYIFVAFIEWLHRLKAYDPHQYALINNLFRGMKPKNFFSSDDQRKNTEHTGQ